MEERKPKPPEGPSAEPIPHYDHDGEPSCRLGTTAMLPLKEVRRQLGWFLISHRYEHED